MFTKEMNEIEFSDIETFCREWPEGVRVEYKKEIANVPKIISSFANTQGGIFIIGVDTDNDNKARFPIEGIANESGIEERIRQSALDGIYPSIMPSIRICDVKNDEGKSGKVAVVIRIDESQQAPHAIQNSTRVYIRSGSITPPYELAEIDRIEYLLKRRDESQKISQQILKRIEGHTDSYPPPVQPILTIYAHPVFPYRPIISNSEIYTYMSNSCMIPTKIGDPEFGTRKVSGGVCFMGKEVHNVFWELNEYGIIYNRGWVLPREDGGQRYFDGDNIIKRIFCLIYEASEFYKKCQYVGNVEFVVALQQIGGGNVRLKDDAGFTDSGREPASVESEISVSAQCLPRNLQKCDEYEKLLAELVDKLFWGLNMDDTVSWKPRWRQRIEKYCDESE